ncbi:hypothetical protein BDV96DRAFT_14274 [Lophiotrema nucula]|uniref:Uncharacterized protein n=1 Tax=Lophiotrema nucula TaxID=690887 RepID=A0A6A5ZUY2_9PLEO|nr:hypothetical protein BDV96DRAFT_14274 [Lophiotrema nucula]
MSHCLSFFFRRMLPFATLLFLAPFINAQLLPRSVTATRVSTLTSVIPPYGSTAASGWGTPTFYASIASIEPAGTIFAITCQPPTKTPMIPLNPVPDPCHINDWGTGSQTFLQGSDAWSFTRTQSKQEFTTECNSPYNCWARNEVGGVEQTTDGAFTDFMLEEQQVIVTAGWESVDNPGGVPEATTTEAIGSFTDIGATNTKGAPVATVTLFKTPEESSAASMSVIRAMAMAAIAAIFTTLVQ